MIPLSMTPCAPWTPFGPSSRAIDWTMERRATFLWAKAQNQLPSSRLVVALVLKIAPVECSVMITRAGSASDCVFVAADLADSISDMRVDGEAAGFGPPAAKPGSHA